ncbi:dienelactone hydrolase family protein [Pseudoduganella aquatica]|nr:CocE/NonD family hydrolase [Pseudoduganella aquatica]
MPVSQLNEQVVMIPAGQGAALETTLFKPDGDGPFPLLVINHGKAPGDPKLQQRDRFVHMARAFVRRGYAVMVPMRAGFAHSGGRYIDHGCDMAANGYTQAADVREAIRYARSLPWVDAQRIVAAGQSYGGLATMALATQQIPGLRGVMNFAGGLRVHGGPCDWQEALVRAFGEYGKRSKVSSLWMYGANDSYFGPELASRMHGAYTRAGGSAELVAFGAFKSDAHTMLASQDGEQVWLPQAERFLARIGMPVKEKFALPASEQAPTEYAAVDDVSALPYLAVHGREEYRAFLQRQLPRAFALSPSGAWGWAEEGEDPRRSALAACQSRSREPCQLYSVDNAVVWPAATSSGGTDR